MSGSRGIDTPYDIVYQNFLLDLSLLWQFAVNSSYVLDMPV